MWLSPQNMCKTHHCVGAHETTGTDSAEVQEELGSEPGWGQALPKWHMFFTPMRQSITSCLRQMSFSSTVFSCSSGAAWPHLPIFWAVSSSGGTVLDVVKMISVRKSEGTGISREQIKREICLCSCLNHITRMVNLPFLIWKDFLGGFFFGIRSANVFALLTVLLISELRLLLAILYSAVGSFLDCYY